MAETISVRVGRSLSLFRCLAGARVRSDFQYRTSFVLRVLGQIGITCLDLLAITFIFNQVPQLAGWSLPEVALLYGINCTAFAFADMAAGALDGMNDHIRSGHLDQILTRPVSPLLFLAADEFALRRIGQLIQATAVLAVAIAAVNHPWSAADVALLMVAIVCGAVIYMAVFVMSGSAIFWLLEGREVVNSVLYGGRFLSEYPLGVYRPWLRRAVVYVVPLAFVAYLPAVTILGKDGPLPYWAGWLSPLVALVLVLVSSLAWRAGVRSYRSTGS